MLLSLLVDLEEELATALPIFGDTKATITPTIGESKTLIQKTPL
jgi:hypothetical protein